MGATRPVAIDVRVVAATHVPLDDRVERGTFRRDLLARLSYFSITVPPLRARRVDILDWLDRFLAGLGVASDAPVALACAAAEDVLLAEWPENLRGLDRLAHRLAARGRAGPIPPEWLGGPERRVEPVADIARIARPAPPGKDELVRLMDELGSVRAVAKHLQRDRRQIYLWLDRFGLGRARKS